MTTINISFKKYLIDTIVNDNNIKHFYTNTFPNSKYTISDIIDGILYVLKTGIAWRDYISFIHWQSLYFHFSRFVKFNIFKKMYLKLRAKYFKNNTTDIQIIDSTFIMNKYGKNKIKRNKYFKNKNCNKISIVTDVNGIPLSAIVNTGNVHDLTFINKHINDMYIFNSRFNKAGIVMLADKSYESFKTRQHISNYNYTLMIPKKANAKNVYYFNKQIYKKRIVVENTFQKIKNFRRIMIRYDSLLKTYYSFVFLAISVL